MISSLVWIRRGAAARHPQKYNITDEAELERVSRITKLEFGDAQAQLTEARKEALRMEQREDSEWEGEDEEEMINGPLSKDGDAMQTGKAETATSHPSLESDTIKMDEDADELAKYNLDDYDTEESKGAAVGAFSNIRGLQFYKSNQDDPYITLQEDADDEAEEREALEVLPSDNLLVTAKTEDEVSIIEAHVYSASRSDNGDDASLYVHHDLLLPSFPLSLEWIGDSSSTTQPRNFLGVSTMEPEIEVWNLDIIDGLVPEIVLGNRAATKEWENRKKPTGKKKKRASRPTSALHHTDAVLSISWNRFVPNLVASSSADMTIKLWDLDAAPADHGGLDAIRSFQIHQDKVQSVAWNTSGSALPSASQVDVERSVLASGGYDGYIKIVDVRRPDQVDSVKVSGEVEQLQWNPWRPNNLLVALDNGLVQSYDIKTLAQGPIWTLSAHETACTSLDVSQHIPGCLLTAGLDRVVKIWNLGEDTVADLTKGTFVARQKPKEISLVTSRDLGAGKLFTAAFSPDEALTIAAAGSGGSVKVWDALGAKGVASAFRQRLREWAVTSGSQEDWVDKGGESNGDLVEVGPDEDLNDDEDEESEGEDHEMIV